MATRAFRGLAVLVLIVALLATSLVLTAGCVGPNVAGEYKMTYKAGGVTVEPTLILMENGEWVIPPAVQYGETD